METDVLKTVRSEIMENSLLAQGSSVVIGLSGGSDSLCLLLLLADLRDEMGLSLYALHVHHGIRGAAADRDRAFCEDICRKLGIPLTVIMGNVPELAKERGIGLEEAGRELRYREFVREANRVGATAIATAHHADDRAETVLFHLLRGTGLRGMLGMTADSCPFDNPKLHLIRPLLTVRKDRILEELALRGQSYCVDETNQSEEYDRNFLRNRILPEMEQRMPRATEHIAAAGERLESVWKLLDGLAEEACDRLIDGEELSADGFLELPEALRQEVALRYLERLCGRRKDLGESHLKLVAGLCQSRVSAEADLPYGLTLVRGYHGISPKTRAEDPAETETPRRLAEEDLLGGISVTVSGKRKMRLSFTVSEYKESRKIPKSNCTKWFDYDKIGRACEIRHRRSGDRLIISPDGHRRSVQDELVNQKIPREDRDRLPVIVSGTGEVLWIPGVRGSEGFRVTGETKRILQITWEPES